MKSGGESAGSETQLFPTLYVGEFAHGLFAVPSLVDEQTLLISPARNTPLLIEGPKAETAAASADIAADLEASQTETILKNGKFPIFFYILVLVARELGFASRRRTLNNVNMCGKVKYRYQMVCGVAKYWVLRS